MVDDHLVHACEEQQTGDQDTFWALELLKHTQAHDSPVGKLHTVWPKRCFGDVGELRARLDIPKDRLIHAAEVLRDRIQRQGSA